jgi:hypothetical protein
MVERLPFGNERRENFSNLHQTFGICADPDSGIPELLLVGRVGSVSRVVSMILLAGLLLFTSGTDIRWLLQLLTMGRLIGRTQPPAVIFPAELAAVDTGIDGFCGAEISLKAAVVR